MSRGRAWTASVAIALLAGAAGATAVLIGPLGFRAPGSNVTAKTTPTPSIQSSPAAAKAPSPRSRAATAFDEATGTVVLFGGAAGSAGSGSSQLNPADLLADTWTWDGSAWTQLAPSSSPPARAGGAMTYDPVRKVVLLWGGFTAQGQSADFWSWNGSDWAQIRTTTAPPAEGIQGWDYPVPVLTYDRARNVITLLRNSGNHPAAPQAPDVWTWEGSSWAHASAANAPSAWGSAAYDTSRSVVVFFAQDGSGSLSTWAYDGAQWTRSSSVSGPGARPDDPPPMVTIGAATAPTLVGSTGEVWAWIGTDWTRQPGSASLPDLAGYSIAYDSRHGVIVLFGGAARGAGSAQAMSNQTWTWGGSGWTKVG